MERYIFPAKNCDCCVKFKKIKKIKHTGVVLLGENERKN